MLQISPEPPEDILETIYTKQLEGCVQFKDTMNLYKLNVSQGMFPPSYLTLKRMVRFYLTDLQNKQHEANLLSVKPGLAAQAVTDPKDKKNIDCRQ